MSAVRRRRRQTESELRRTGLFRVGGPAAVHAAPVVQYAAQTAVQQSDHGGDGQRFGREQRTADGKRPAERGDVVDRHRGGCGGGRTTAAVRRIVVVLVGAGDGRAQIPFVFVSAGTRLGQAAAVHDAVTAVQSVGQETNVHVVAAERWPGPRAEGHTERDAGKKERVRNRLR